MARVRWVRPFLICLLLRKTWLQKFLCSLLTKRSVTWFHNMLYPNRWCDDAWHFHSCGRHVAIQCLFSVERHPDHTVVSSRRKSQLTQAHKPEPTVYTPSLTDTHTYCMYAKRRTEVIHSSVIQLPQSYHNNRAKFIFISFKVKFFLLRRESNMHVLINEGEGVCLLALRDCLWKWQEWHVFTRDE